MGFTKRYLEEVEERGWTDTEAVVCTDCLTEPALVEAISHLGDSNECSFCRRPPHAASAPMRMLLDTVVQGLRFEYEDPIHMAAYDSEDGYLVHTWYTDELLAELDVSESVDVLNAFTDAIEQGMWCKRDPYAASPAEALVWGWDAFKDFVKTSRRYTFLVPDRTTADGAGSLAMHSVPAAIAEAVASAGLVTSLPQSSKWWRARVGPAGQLFTTASEIGTPPPEYAKDNRMSGKGIGAFYGATSLDGAIAEVAGYVEPPATLSVGQFSLVDSVRVIDLRDVPAVPSLFDPSLRELRAPIAFLQSFVEDIRKPSSPGDIQNLDYVPAQVITEYLKYQLPSGFGSIDGVVWRSSKDSAVDVCALFIDNKDFADLGSESDSTRMNLDPATLTYRSLDS